MIDLLIDNAVLVLVALALVAGALATWWWNTRKRWALFATFATLAVAAGVILLQQFVVTDTGQMQLNVAHIRDAVNGGKYDEALRYFDDKVKITATSGMVLDLDKDKILKMATRTRDHYAVKQIQTGSVEVLELNKPHAKIRFLVGDADETYKRGYCIMDCEYKQGKWLVTTMTVEAMIGGSKMPVLLPVQ
jgi:hypothetical protein